ncbi:hypothetical protein [Accumulibacter sp.]|uniref:hypothetical protein n=1 Tax=Accumulibacter sp. TaxID=2053492 RepID=UPI0026228BB4|nr:hypothetical protein [Accumulibacter sp.]
MEKWITRVVAVLCAGGSTALFWTFGVFLAVPWRESRLLSLNGIEMQVLAIPLLAGLAVAWGALHILALADRDDNPKTYYAICLTLLVGSLLAIYGGLAWGTARIA